MPCVPGLTLPGITGVNPGNKLTGRHSYQPQFMARTLRFGEVNSLLKVKISQGVTGRGLTSSAIKHHYGCPQLPRHTVSL